MSTQNQTPQPLITPENPPERHLHAVPDLPSERSPLYGPYTDVPSAAKMSLEDLEDVPQVNLNPDILKQARQTRSGALGRDSLMFYYRERARDETDPGYRHI